jgi:hypothetical protein
LQPAGRRLYPTELWATYGGEILAKSKLEQAAHRRRRDRSVKDSRRLVRGFGLAAGHEGHALVNRHLGRLVDFMREVLRDPPTSRQGRKMPSLTVEVHALIKGVPVEALALAALAGTMNATRAAPAKGGEEGHSPGRVAVEIVGAEIERAARAHYLKTEHPHLLKRIDCATAHKARLKARLALERKILADRGVRFDWKRFDRLHVGAWGIACCFEALPDVFVLEQNVPAIAESAWNVAEAVATQQMLRHCPQTPLLVPPKPWTWSRNDDGLDFLKGCRDQEAVQRAIVSGTLRPHMDAINYLQSTAFKIDPDVLSLVRNHSL